MWDKAFIVLAVMMAPLGVMAKEGPPMADGLGIGMADPSAVYCKELGLETHTARGENGETGICIMPDGTECD